MIWVKLYFFVYELIAVMNQVTVVQSIKLVFNSFQLISSIISIILVATIW